MLVTRDHDHMYGHTLMLCSPFGSSNHLGSMGLQQAAVFSAIFIGASNFFRNPASLPCVCPAKTFNPVVSVTTIGTAVIAGCTAPLRLVLVGFLWCRRIALQPTGNRSGLANLAVHISEL